MTAKIVKGSSFSGAVGYMLSKEEKAEILKAEGVVIGNFVSTKIGKVKST